jgi:phosphopantetheinyl transferase (holo-ACP synthase)
LPIDDEAAEGTVLVGNDIVDLHDPESHPGALHDRFDVRAFTDDERAGLSVSDSPHRLRWTLWAAKESAFKVAKKIDPGVVFHPRDFRVRQIGRGPAGEGEMGEGSAVVLHEIGSFAVWLDRTDEWVHAVATLSFADVLSAPRPASGAIPWPAVAGVERLQPEDADPGRRVRELACAAVGSRLQLPPGHVHIEADGRIPVAFSGGRRLPVDLSLSHHGRFVAWAWGEHAAGPTRGALLAEIRVPERSA